MTDTTLGMLNACQQAQNHSVVLQVLSWKQGLSIAEITQIADPQRIQNPVQRLE